MEKQDGSKKILNDSERYKLLEALHKKYAKASTWQTRIFYAHKKYSWLFVVGLAKILKRFIDISAAVVLLIILSPLMLLLAIIIKLTDGGPVFYVSNRVGKWGREFACPKFRSMVANADKMKEQLKESNEQTVTFKMKRDPRITWIGFIMRKTSLDELPQLWCIIKGDMSLVGPRPPLPQEVALYNLNQRRRLDVTPGLTCIWQVSGRSEIPFEKQVNLDLEYIESQSLWLDIKLLLKTIPAVLFGRGAY